MRRLTLTLLLLACFAPLAFGTEQASLLRSGTANDQVSISFSSPVVYRIERFNKPARLVMNLYAVRSDGAARDLTRLKASWLKSVRTEPILGDSLRVTLTLRDDSNLDIYGVPPASTLILARGSGNYDPAGRPEDVRPREGRPDGAAAPDAPVPFRDPVLNTPRPDPAANTGGGYVEPSRTQVTRIDFQHGDTECRLQLDLNQSIQPQAFLLMTDPRHPRLVMDLPNARVIPAEQTIDVPDNPLVRQLRVGVFEHKGARIVMDLKRKVNFSFSGDRDTGQVVLNLSVDDSAPGVDIGGTPSNDTPGGGDFTGIAPSLESGSLEGKTIVIDAGHGGHDKGTNGYGLLEKNVALDISRRLTRLLKDAGVNAVLTRSDDTFIRLPDRPAVANRLGADAFVAVHLNSTGSVRNIWSGTETYYHFQDPVCRELAQYIQAQLVQAIGLPDRGARSDTRIAPHMGFSVLRNSQVPAVLVEVGYLNHPGDAGKLGNPDFRERAAQGIMAGLRSYFSRNEQSARRSSGK